MLVMPLLWKMNHLILIKVGLVPMQAKCNRNMAEHVLLSSHHMHLDFSAELWSHDACSCRLAGYPLSRIRFLFFFL